ncbi:VOC family protein [Mesorhizobium sp. RCC_202]|uniref:VOC family protein n=1 Tax=Mesorhizobium sp. RCC_202 TaxID=3239222 RepID=UPI003523AAF1
MDTIKQTHSARTGISLAIGHSLDTVVLKQRDVMHSETITVRDTTKQAAGLPGLRGTDHIGFTVPDLDQAVHFFVEIIGCEAFYELGPFQSDTDWMQTHLNVHPRTLMKRLKFLRCRHGSNFEIFEYTAPDQNSTPPSNSDVGGHHLAFYVDDINEAVAYLKSRGVRVLGEPTVRTRGPSAGQSWVYFLSPWGMQLELVSFPAGKAYERDTERRLWHPANPKL